MCLDPPMEASNYFDCFAPWVLAAEQLAAVESSPMFCHRLWNTVEEVRCDAC